MTRTPIPVRHWRSYGNDPLPSGAEALDEPFAAFPSWFMRVTCERCGHERMFNESHSAQRWMLISTILDRMRHDGARRSKAAEGSANLFWWTDGEVEGLESPLEAGTPTLCCNVS